MGEEMTECTMLVMVYTVWRADDESTHIFSTPEKAESYAHSIDVNCVLSIYIVDEPQHYYERIN